MTESEFQRRAIDFLTRTGNVVLRICDRADARRGMYGLHVAGGPKINATGPDLLVLRRGDIGVIKTASLQRIRDYAVDLCGPVMFELKTPQKMRRTDQHAQERWVEVVAGGYSE